MRLVVSQPVEKMGDAGSARRPDTPRPTLTLLRGGLARPKRLGRAGSPAPEPAPPPTEPGLRVEEIAIYLRPIPAWVPRLW